MILQRLASAIRHQNWSQIVIEILIVVIGIFLGLQVTEWNKTRVEKVEEHGYLLRLHQDFNKSIEINRARIDVLNRLIDYSKLMKKSLELCQLSEQEEDDFASGLYLIGKTIPPHACKRRYRRIKINWQFPVNK